MSDLLERLKTEGNPLILHDEALFVWEGDTAPYLHIETENFKAVQMQQTEPGLWTYQVRLPDDAYIEYNFSSEANDPDTILTDPHNPNTFDTGLGHENHFFTMPGRVHTPLTMTHYGIEKGTVTDHRLQFPGTYFDRDLWLYAPPTSEPVPLVVVLDGKDYLERGHLTTIVDNLINDGKIQPVAMAMIDNAGPHRMLEYNEGDTMPYILEHGLLPFARQYLSLTDVRSDPGAYGILGASMGGLMALYTGLRLPDIFGKVISQAGAFKKLTDERPGLIHVLVDELPAAPIKVWLDCGIYDFLFDENRDMRHRLTTKGYDVTYAEHADGHNYTAWRDVVGTALETMYGV